MRATTGRYGVLALLSITFLLAAACGQKAGVHQPRDVVVGTEGPGARGGMAAGDAGDGIDTDGDGVADAPGTSGGSAGRASGGGGAGGRSSTDGARRGGDGDSAGGGTDGAGGPAWGDKIVIGVHAPITGAAPLPNSFVAAAGVYPEWINSKGGIHGRTVEVVVVDDTYQPGPAVQRCTELVQQRNAFLLIGGGGTDQIQACARQAANLGVPYLSAGVTEIGLSGLPNYFAVSMSYKAQGPYLARYIKANFADRFSDPACGDSCVAMVYSDTRNFSDGRDAFVSAVESLGGKVKLYRLSRNPSQGELQRTATQMCTDGVRVAYPLMAPTSWLFLAGRTKPVCNPQWAGVGLTMGLNAVAGPGCQANNSIEGAVFFSPFPGTDTAPGLDPDFVEAVRGKNWDDIYVALWTVLKPVGEMLKAAGPDLTRSAFVSTAEQTKGLATGMNPPVSYSPSDHFGADQVHVLRADCSSGTYKTIGTFQQF